jgi:heme/copper-type cytochrome/quinol oxidase subunit 3
MGNWLHSSRQWKFVSHNSGARNIMDQNWYTQDLSPKPPRKKSYLWVWILGGCLMFAGFIMAVVLLVASQIPPGKTFGDWIAETASHDNSQIVEFRASGATERLQAARTAYGNKLLPSNDVSVDEITLIESFLQELTNVIQEKRQRQRGSRNTQLPMRAASVCMRRENS